MPVFFSVLWFWRQHGTHSQWHDQIKLAIGDTVHLIYLHVFVYLINVFVYN